jgi:exonuclease III
VKALTGGEFVKIATYDVNGINGRPPVQPRWLAEAIACLRELKAPQEKFPQSAIEKAGCGAVSGHAPVWIELASPKKKAKC